MKITYKAWFILLLVPIALFSCNDHRLGGSLSPVRLRLKTTNDGTTLVTYNYDSQNQPASITRNQITSSIMHGDPQRVLTDSDPYATNVFYIRNSAQANSTVIVFPPVLSNTSFLATEYGRFNTGKIFFNVPVRKYTYDFDTSGRLTRISDFSDAPDINGASYEYTGENITKENVFTSAGHGDVYTNTFTYDDKINPFYGLLDPQINARLRFSRNNILTLQSAGRGAVPNTTYAYEYNAQGLPTKLTTTVNGNQSGITTFTYESY
ncbi:hypothetical protein GO755_26390 [Spirosoma sp. HMF4905]|uniref:DUF4595 domain-containing protein n=1 Tax=Spirosoma arboris TaxID=2682092 RepID=A0A7K1SIJ4_9BACT|nr:hypothetical protein [Spirosoma arboris]MVM33595.1 hypothetical protein [Spirosoma arboris]